jgi:citrate lyase subunit alpha/citrate CoA-transferase
MAILEKTELVLNAAGRKVPEMVNGRVQAPYLGVGKYRPHGYKAAPPIRTAADYPNNGDKRVADLESALRKCGRAMAWSFLRTITCGMATGLH